MSSLTMFDNKYDLSPVGCAAGCELKRDSSNKWYIVWSGNVGQSCHITEKYSNVMDLFSKVYESESIWGAQAGDGFRVQLEYLFAGKKPESEPTWLFDHIDRFVNKYSFNN